MIDIFVPIGVALVLLGLFMTARVITTLFHELGHAIPAMIFTKEKVSIFLGSYGDIESSKHLSFGKLFSIYFKLNPLTWTGGMARHSGNNLTTWKKLVIFSLGPLCSLVLASIAIFVIYSFNLNILLKALSIIFFISAIFDLRSLYPDDSPIKLPDGRVMYCDGYQILKFIKFRKEDEKLNAAYLFYENKNYGEAIRLFEGLNPDYVDENIFKIIISTYCFKQDYEGAKFFYPPIFNRSNFQFNDFDTFISLGVIEANLGNNDLAMDFFNRSLELEKNNIYALANRGYTHNIFETYAEAIKDFDDAIQIKPDFAYAFANRGYSKIKLNLLKDGLDDINDALEMDDKEPYAYRNLGVYYLVMANYEKALLNFQLAYELSPDTHRIDEFMKAANEKLLIT